MIKQYKGFKIPKKIKLKATKILHQGEQHSHHFIKGESLIGEGNGKKYLRVKKLAIVDHAEHGKGDIPVGDYYVEVKLEYDHFLNESREVID